MPKDFDHIVIGAGISGLGAAHFSTRRGLKTLILEASERIGGCINSQRFEALGGYWTEGGGHTCFNSYGNMLSILDDLGLTAQVQPKVKVGYSLWKDGKRRKVTSQLHFFEAARSIPRIFKAPKVGRSVRDYYGEVLGQRNYQDLLQHAFQAVICQPADDYPAEALFRRKPRRKDVIKAFTFAEGISTIPAAIAAQEGLEVRTGQQVAEIQRQDAAFSVRLQDGSALTAGALTLAVPPDVATQLMPAGFEAARDAISGIGMAEIETLVLAFDKSALTLPPMAGLIAVEDAFYSAVSRDFLPDARYRGFAFHFKPNALAPEAQVERACAILGTSPDRVAAQAHVANRLPALRSGHGERVAKLDTALAGTRLGVTGNWFFGVSMEDALTRSRSESDRVFGQ
ncbi:FAD-dependent oxidoreductase [Thiorhodococcus mannitoliphagus]|uniref:FAD-dependent oxidoreductase n=1 Tax=Thiorhodococcus mannitoliphagus TaxID=329406 RepID=A0A6P1DVT3_9GAMM|nr:FAD-dependent oxidoreductase [Thiorhodococcus mannitoliphagus]NEX22248.1 FAD-dependent oxidoreductase [Thiorhodococcus mannitoliphagus]